MKIPFVKSKLANIKPEIEDVLLHFFQNEVDLTFLDVGANRGQTIDIIWRYFPNATIYSFEPTPDVFDFLKAKYRSSKNVFLYKVALADEDGKLNFYASDFSATNSCLKPNKELYNQLNFPNNNVLNETVSYKVKSIKLDTWYNSNISEKPVDIIKIDTQGFEYNVIKGGLNTLRNYTKVLCFEVHFLEFYYNTIPFYKTFELLYENGFYLYSLIPSEKRDKFQYLESDAIFVNSKFIEPHDSH